MLCGSREEHRDLENDLARLLDCRAVFGSLVSTIPSSLSHSTDDDWVLRTGLRADPLLPLGIAREGLARSISGPVVDVLRMGRLELPPLLAL